MRRRQLTATPYTKSDDKAKFEDLTLKLFAAPDGMIAVNAPDSRSHTTIFGNSRRTGFFPPLHIGLELIATVVF